MGARGRPWRLRGAIRAFSGAGPDTVRVAAAYAPYPARAQRCSTETRIAALDDEARRAFARYWRLVGPWSALVRRRWLAAAARALAD